MPRQEPCLLRTETSKALEKVVGKGQSSLVLPADPFGKSGATAQGWAEGGLQLCACKTKFVLVLLFINYWIIYYYYYPYPTLSPNPGVMVPSHPRMREISRSNYWWAAQTSKVKWLPKWKEEPTGSTECWHELTDPWLAGATFRGQESSQEHRQAQTW